MSRRGKKERQSDYMKVTVGLIIIDNFQYFFL